MQFEIGGKAVAVMVVLGAIGAYFILALRLPHHLALALALFGACIVGMFAFALRTALGGSHGHDHGD